MLMMHTKKSMLGSTVTSVRKLTSCLGPLITATATGSNAIRHSHASIKFVRSSACYLSRLCESLSFYQERNECMPPLLDTNNVFAVDHTFIKSIQHTFGPCRNKPARIICMRAMVGIWAFVVQAVPPPAIWYVYIYTHTYLYTHI